MGHLVYRNFPTCIDGATKDLNCLGQLIPLQRMLYNEWCGAMFLRSQDTQTDADMGHTRGCQFCLNNMWLFIRSLRLLNYSHDLALSIFSSCVLSLYLSLSIFLSIYLIVYPFVPVPIHLSIWLSPSLSIYIYILYIYIYIYIYYIHVSNICICRCSIYICTYVYRYRYVCVYVYAYVYMYICVY